MTTETLIVSSGPSVKDDFIESLSDRLEALEEAAQRGSSVRELEVLVWSTVITLGRLLLGYALAVACRRATVEDVQERDLNPDDFSLRADRDYWTTLTSTFGTVTFPLFAYRDRSSGLGSVTRTPARDRVLPLYPRCRSTELCLEWEVKLGSEQPFRKAQDALSYFTHGAASLEDTTIARHMKAVGSLVGPEWTYRRPEDIRRILESRATRDQVSGRPIVYASSDAHALRRYVDETWDAHWKMANGIRICCVDARSGAILHLGGEYTWGDCRQVAASFQWLIDTGRLPSDGDYGDGLVAHIVFVTDGAPWLEDHVLSLFPRATKILDVYHLMEKLGDDAALRFGRGTKEAIKWYETALSIVMPGRKRRPRKSRTRKGHRKRSRADRLRARAASSHPGGPRPELDADRHPTGERLLEHLQGERVAAAHQEDREALLRYVDNNAERMDYVLYRQRGLQIGSGAMESLHRTASQQRLKIPGGRWLAESSEAIFNLRMMALAGRWDEFWEQSRLGHLLATAFGAPANDDATSARKAA